MSPSHRMRKWKIGKKSVKKTTTYVFFQILFEKVHFQLIKTPFLQYFQNVQKLLSPKGSKFSAVFSAFSSNFRQIYRNLPQILAKKTQTTES